MAGQVPIVLTGNCNSSLGTTAALASERLGVLRFDAHADFDVPDDAEESAGADSSTPFGLSSRQKPQ